MRVAFVQAAAYFDLARPIAFLFPAGMRYWLSLLLLLGVVSRLEAEGFPLPGNTITNEKGTTLQFGVRNQILAMEKKTAPGCSRPRISNTEIIGQRTNVRRMSRWDEQWTIDRCGVPVIYRIHFEFRGSVGNYQIRGPFPQVR